MPPQRLVLYHTFFQKSIGFRKFLFFLFFPCLAAHTPTFFEKTQKFFPYILLLLKFLSSFCTNAVFPKFSLRFAPFSPSLRTAFFGLPQMTPLYNRKFFVFHSVEKLPFLLFFYHKKLIFFCQSPVKPKNLNFCPKKFVRFANKFFCRNY